MKSGEIIVCTIVLIEAWPTWRSCREEIRFVTWTSNASSSRRVNKEKLQWRVNGSWSEFYFKSVFQHALLCLKEAKEGERPTVGPSCWTLSQKEGPTLAASSLPL